MADSEQDVGGDFEASASDVSSGAGAATDFPKVEPMNAAEDPALENFLPDPADQTLPGEEKEES